VTFLSDFFIKSTDSIFNRLIKLEIIASITTKQNIAMVLREFQIYVKHPNKQFVAATIKAVGKVVDIDPELTAVCMQGMLYLIACNKEPIVVEEVINTLRLILIQNFSMDTSLPVLHSIIKSLVKEEDSLDIPAARSGVVWLVGEFLDNLTEIAPDILRVLGIIY